ncbi:MAG: hypothetical protein FJW30_29370 [Acidobacteria bacterium]|nr:hypothetical protein [Acidobacteriota bacterium]
MKHSLWLLLLLAALASGQPHGVEQTDFPVSEFQERRGKVFDAIGRSIALIPGASAIDSPPIYWQSNEFYYLTGLESANSHLLLDGRTRRTTVYLQHRNPALERTVGPLVSAEDAELVKERTGVDDVHGVEMLARHLAPIQIHHPVPRCMCRSVGRRAPPAAATKCCVRSAKRLPIPGTDAHRATAACSLYCAKDSPPSNSKTSHRFSTPSGS